MDKITVLIVIGICAIFFILGGAFGYNICKDYTNLKLKELGYRIYKNETIINGVSSNWWELVKIGKDNQ